MEARTTIGISIPYIVDEVQHVIPIRCGDARDVGAVENEIMQTLIIEYAARGVKVDVSRVTIAGAVVNKQSYIEIKDIVKQGLTKNLEEFGERLVVSGNEKNNVLQKTVTQISGHADVQVKGTTHKLTYTPQELEIVDAHSRVNCGMSHASEAWVKIQEVLFQVAPEIQFFDKTEKKEKKIKIKDKKVLYELLKSSYAHDGASADDFLTSIDLIKQPEQTKLYLRKMLDSDNELARVPIHINYGLINYRTGLKLRMDGNEHIHTILDDVSAVMRYVMEKLPSDHPEKIARSSTQKPVAGLICSPLIQNPRETMVKYIKLTENNNIDVAGSVFLVTGMNVLNPFSSFGPYKLGGICYSIMVLGIRHYYVIGKDSNDVMKIKRKVINDPILKTIIEHYKVKVTGLTISDIQAKGVSQQAISVDENTRSVIREAIQKFSKHPKSVLNRPVKTSEVFVLLANSDIIEDK